MTKADLVNRLIDRGLNRHTALAAVDTIISSMAQALASGQSITLRGLATFSVRLSKPKIARNITQGTFITIPPRRTVKLVLSRHIKDSLTPPSDDAR